MKTTRTLLVLAVLGLVAGASGCFAAVGVRHGHGHGKSHGHHHDHGVKVGVAVR